MVTAANVGITDCDPNHIDAGLTESTIALMLTDLVHAFTEPATLVNADEAPTYDSADCPRASSTASANM